MVKNRWSAEVANAKIAIGSALGWKCAFAHWKTGRRFVGWRLDAPTQRIPVAPVAVGGR